MRREQAPKKGMAWDVPVTAVAISAVSLISEAFTQSPDAGPIMLSTIPAIAAGVARKRYFAYSLLLGSAGWAATDNALPYVVMLPVAGTFFFAALDKRLPKQKEDDGGEIH